MLNIERAENYGVLSERAAEITTTTLKEKPGAVLGLPTGSTPEGMYQELIKTYQSGGVSFADATTFNLDEYVGLSADDPNSYRYYMRKKLFDLVDIKEGAYHLPDGEAADRLAACQEYDASIERAGGIDLQFIGIGLNGHIGFNEPHTAFSERTHIVELNDSTRQANSRYFSSLSEVPKQAITMGIQTIMESKKLVLLAAGAEKASVLERLVYGDVTEAFPASIIKQHPNLTIIADQAALTGLNAADYSGS